MKFSELSIHPDLIRAAGEMGFESLTPIQEQCLEPGLNGRDIAGVSQTGTGKTVAFLLPILHSIFGEAPKDQTAALVVSPTRELCLQIAEEAERLCQFHPMTIAAIYGGEDYSKQERALAKHPALIVATPGRLIDYMKQRKIDVSALRYLVLDEADRMLDMGFIKDVRYIMRHVPESANTFLFSATLSYYIMRLAADFMNDPVEVRIESESVAVDKIAQNLLHLSRDEKDAYLLNQLLNLDNPRAIVFTNYKHAVTRIVRRLQKYGIAATGISSLLDQKKRVKLLKGFKTGHYSVLVATDVASRGLDVEDITHVFNYDLPQDAESYVHRIGRTARAGKSGISFAYCSEDDYENLPRIERYMEMKIPVAEIQVDWLKFPTGQFTAFFDKFGSAHRADGKDGPKARSERSRPQRGKRRDRKTGGRKEVSRDSSSKQGKERQSPRQHKNQGRSHEDSMTIREQDRAFVLSGRGRDYSEDERLDRQDGPSQKRSRRKGPRKRHDRQDRQNRAREAKPRKPKQGSERRATGKIERRTVRSVRNKKGQKKGLLTKIKSIFQKQD